MTYQEMTNHPMMTDFISFTKATGIEIKTEKDIEGALLKWVNHRVETTPELLDYMYRKTVKEIKG